MRKIFTACLAALISLLVITSCASSSVEKNHEKNIQLLKNCAPYTTDTVSIEKQYLADEKRAKEIREYFAANTELDLDALKASEKSTWEKALDLAVFVAKNIPHDNQKVQLEHRNAITLWEYHLENPKGFNCRYHGILLSELLLSIGIKNSYVTCRPYDKNDGDCHVVNIVWLPELDKWAMIDSDMVEYTTDENGTPLSLQEMRSFIQQDKAFTINVLPGLEKHWVAAPSGKAYMQAYWAKNLYWFDLFTVYAFDLEYGYNSEGVRTYYSEYTCLVPPDFDSPKLSSIPQKTSNAEAFWSK